MNFYGYDQDKAIANCSSRSQGQYQPKLATVRSWQKLGPEHVIGLLDNAAFATRPQARQLAGLISQMSWRILATVHAGGTGDLRGVDNVPHVTISVSGRTYHLRCKEDPSLHVIQITV